MFAAVVWARFVLTPAAALAATLMLSACVPDVSLSTPAGSPALAHAEGHASLDGRYAPRTTGGDGWADADRVPASAFACSGTGDDGPRVQVVYAAPAGRSRLDVMLPGFVRALGQVDALLLSSGLGQGGDGRLVRWVTGGGLPGCVPSVREVALPPGWDSGDSWAVSPVFWLGTQPDGRRLLILVDNVENTLPICGTASRPEDARDVSYQYALAACPGVYALAHELLHALGAVGDHAPHVTPAYHCTDESDLMCYADTPGTVMEQVCAGDVLRVDCGNDDYFDVLGRIDPRGNTALSPFLDVVPRVVARSLLPGAPALSVLGRARRLVVSVESPAGGFVSFRVSPGGCAARVPVAAGAQVVALPARCVTAAARAGARVSVLLRSASGLLLARALVR